MCVCVCLFVCQSDEDYETYDTVLELDEVLNLDTDAERTAYIQVPSSNEMSLLTRPIFAIRYDTVD